ncbi:MAG: radical SAM protein [Bacteroides sp.]|nr:radical SAM protein [Barnesiella sp.]MBD5345380.1 radical SAM protein [Bacteroides sp.]MBD5368169.1 radical SAM protein [Bacteroides sp.]
MQTVLFHSTVFGPIHSRRLGVSLGINLDPDDGKVCSFDCLYCEAGFNAQGTGTTGLPPREHVSRMLGDKLRAMSEAGEHLDVITFSGNGEPTMHPEFAGIIDDTIALRDRWFPDVKISVLTNSTRLDHPDVAAALRKVDNNIVKLDSAVTSTMRLIDRPVSPAFTSERAVEMIRPFGRDCVVQTMLLRGSWNGEPVDNTTPAEIDALIEAYRTIGPRQVMIYSIDRRTPARELVKVPREELEQIAARIRRETGIDVSVA